MRTKALVLAVLILGCMPLAAPADARVAAPPPSGAIDLEAECSSTATIVPERYETPVTGDWTTEVVLDVHVLAVEVDEVLAAEIMDHVAALYEPLGIKVKSIIEPVNIEIEPDTSGALLSTSESRAYIQASKDHFGGARPWWADVVYTMLGGEIASTVAGQADCVGGIAYDDAAFAVGEAETVNEYTMKKAAKIAGHEIAHLLAAHHHFANCAEGDKTATVEDLTPCTLLFNDVGLISLAFSTLEGAVVREYALEYANDTPTEPPGPEEKPPPQTVIRTVDLMINKDLVARGGVEDEGVSRSMCTAEVPITLEQKRPGRWRMLRNSATDVVGAFRFRLRKPGTYRVRADQIRTGDNMTCYEAVSPAVKAR